MVLSRASRPLLALLAFVAVDAGPGAAEAPLTEPPPVLLSRQLVDARGLKLGQIVQLAPEASGEGARPFRIAGVYEPLPDPFRLTAVIDPQARS